MPEPMSLVSAFDDLPDPRRSQGLDHRLTDLLLIAVCTLRVGGESAYDMEDSGRAREDWLRTFLPLPDGIASHGTFNRLFQALEPAGRRRRLEPPPPGQRLDPDRLRPAATGRSRTSPSSPAPCAATGPSRTNATGFWKSPSARTRAAHVPATPLPTSVSTSVSPSTASEKTNPSTAVSTANGSTPQSTQITCAISSKSDASPRIESLAGESGNSAKYALTPKFHPPRKADLSIGRLVGQSYHSQ